MEKDIIHDEEYQKFKEEQLNTMKMSTILKSLNAPFRRSKKAGALSTHGAAQVHGGSAGSAVGSGRGGMRRYNSSTKSSQKFVDHTGALAASNTQPHVMTSDQGSRVGAPPDGQALNTDLQANQADADSQINPLQN